MVKVYIYIYVYNICIHITYVHTSHQFCFPSLHGSHQKFFRYPLCLCGSSRVHRRILKRKCPCINTNKSIYFEHMLCVFPAYAYVLIVVSMPFWFSAWTQIKTRSFWTYRDRIGRLPDTNPCDRRSETLGSIHSPSEAFSRLGRGWKLEAGLGPVNVYRNGKTILVGGLEHVFSIYQE